MSWLSKFGKNIKKAAGAKTPIGVSWQDVAPLALGGVGAGAVGAGAGASAGGTAAAGGGGIMGTLGKVGGWALDNPELIGAGISLVGGYGAEKKGNKQQDQALALQQEAINLAKENYGERAPYRKLGGELALNQEREDLSGIYRSENPFAATNRVSRPMPQMQNPVNAVDLPMGGGGAPLTETDLARELSTRSGTLGNIGRRLGARQRVSA